MAGGEPLGPAPAPFDGGLTVGQRIGHVETAVVGLSNPGDLLEGWRDELRGALALLKFRLGTSLVSGLLAIVTLIRPARERRREAHLMLNSLDLSSWQRSTPRSRG
jgi:hypothetical protein